jgi:hypothetical protein
MPITPDRQTAPGDLFGDVERAAQGAVAADAEQDADVEIHEPVDHLADILRPARRAENRAALLVDFGHEIRVEHERLNALLLDHALEAVAKPIDGLDLVPIRELHDQSPDHVVDAGTQPAARHDADLGFRRIEEYLLARAGLLERTRHRPRFEQRFQLGGRDLIDDPLLVGNVVGEKIAVDERQGQRGRPLRGAEHAHAKVV